MASSSRLKPGEKGNILVRLTPDKAGMFAKTVVVYTNDTKRPAVVLTVKAEVSAAEKKPESRDR